MGAGAHANNFDFLFALIEYAGRSIAFGIVFWFRLVDF
jgi:hypothetical protein